MATYRENPCKNCGKEGHNTRTCGTARRCSQCGKPGHYTPTCPFNKPLRYCANCGKSGHYLTSCPGVEGRHCSKCGRSGHYAATCKFKKNPFEFKAPVDWPRLPETIKVILDSIAEDIDPTPFYAIQTISPNLYTDLRLIHYLCSRLTYIWKTGKQRKILDSIINITATVWRGLIEDLIRKRWPAVKFDPTGKDAATPLVRFYNVPELENGFLLRAEAATQRGTRPVLPDQLTQQ
jgi:hypothetical protein